MEVPLAPQPQQLPPAIEFALSLETLYMPLHSKKPALVQTILSMSLASLESLKS
jgi:hypothetical protein